MRFYCGDLHIHTVLSPCAQYTMVPTLIVERALKRGIDFIAITDHNSSENVEAVMQAAKATELVVLPGMEVETREEVHVVVLFEAAQQARCWQETVYAHMPDLPNDEDAFGVQLVVNSDDELVCREGRRLLIACDLSVDQVFEQVGRLGGFCIPAHVDRPSYSLLNTLGFIPPTLDVPAVEVSRWVRTRDAARRLPGVGEREVIWSSDAHSLEDVGLVRTCFEMREPTLSELILACRGHEGRRVRWASIGEEGHQAED